MIIKTTELKRSFEVGSETVDAIKGINLEVDAGEFIAIMGPSGSGKTTLMNIIGCLDTPTSGEYYLNNKLVNQLNEDELAGIRNKEIGFVFQSFHLLAKNSALDNVLLPMKYAGANIDEATVRAKHVLNQVGLSDRMSHGPTELSGGQQQRAAICRALICQPKVLLADEPTGALDQENSEHLMTLLTELNLVDGLTIFMITHDAEVANYADRVLHLVDGKLAT